MATEKFNKAGWIVVNTETRYPQALDAASGGYPLNAISPSEVHFFPDEAAARKYASHTFENINLKAVQALLTIEYEMEDVVRGYVPHEFEPFHPDWHKPRCKICTQFEDHTIHIKPATYVSEG